MNNDKTPNDRATPRTEATFNALVDAFVSYDKKQLYFSDLANACYVAKCDFQDVERELTEAKAARDDALIAVDSWVAECKELRVEAERLKARNQRLLSACKGSLKDQRHLNDVAEAVVTERDQLRAQLAELEKDKARLDKIDYPSFIDGGDQGYGYWSWEVTQGSGQPRYWEPKASDPRPRIRDAIDAT